MKLFKNLQTVEHLKRRMQSLAALDAVLCPEYEYRYYRFDSNWSDAEAMGTVQNGSGDEVFILFSELGCFVKVFAHEYLSSCEAEIYSRVPDELKLVTSELAFSVGSVTACFWMLSNDDGWNSSPNLENIPKGSLWMLEELAGEPVLYKKFIDSYLEVSVPLNPIKAVFGGEPLSLKLLELLGFSGEMEALKNDLQEVQYPYVGF